VNAAARIVCVALIVSALCAIPQLVSAQSAPPPAVYALTHAKIFTLVGPAIEDGTLIIRDGKIAAVGTGIDVPSGAQVIDTKGLQIYPGLFDSITQMGLREIGAVSSTVDETETGDFNPDVVAATAILPSSEHITVTRAAGITEVLAVPASAALIPSGAQDSLAVKPRPSTCPVGPSTKCSSKRAPPW
jgi:imidazolonepropionase-like amidohydrolase